MALPPLQDLLDLLQDNNQGDISAQDMQDIVTALYDGILSGGAGGGGGGSIPVGGVIPWTTDDIPDGFLECTGAEIDRTTYADLFAVIDTIYGSGDSITTFNLPNYQGWFLRGVDNGVGIDPDAAARSDRGDGVIGDNVGTKQQDQFDLHGHPTRTSAKDANTSDATGGLMLDDDKTNTNRGAWAGTPSDTAGRQVGGSGGNETRAKNIYVRFIIRWEQVVSSFTSAPIDIVGVDNQYAAIPHGLGLPPSRIESWLVCLDTDKNYVAGDRVRLVGLRWDGTLNNGIEVSADSTNINVVQMNEIYIVNKTDSQLSGVNISKWQLLLVASI